MLPLSAKLKARLNRSSPAARDAELGSRLEAAETFDIVAVDYDSGAADATLTADEIGSSPVAVITATAASGAVNLILPKTPKKVYILVNGSGQAVTAKVTGQTGISVANAKTAILYSNGTDIKRAGADI